MFCYVNKLNRPWTLRSGGSPINNQSRVFADVAVFQAARHDTPANCIPKNGCQRLTLAAQRRVECG